MSIDTLINTIVDEFIEDRIPGWCTVEKALDLACTVVALRPKIVVEVGVFGGRSLIPMALACEAIDSGVVIGIDPWSPAASVEGYSGENETWWRDLDHEAIYRSFLGNVDRLGLKNRVAVERAKSDDSMVPESIDLLHIDGQHSEQAIRDVKKFASRVRVGGITVLDDLDWKNSGVPHVSMAADELKKLGFDQMYPSGTGAFFQRVRMPTSRIKR